MIDQTRLCLLALHFIPGVGDYLLRQLVSYCGSAERVFTIPKGKLLKVPGVGEVTANAILAHKTFDLAEKEIRKAEKLNTQLIFYLDKDYPSRLKQIPDAPTLLYGKGAINFENPKSVAIVGTRKATAYGRECVEQLISELLPHQALIISGLAYGIDIQAHKQAVKQGLQTIAVMGSGIDVIYPASHKDTANQMQNNGGIITENRLGAKPDAHNFPMRNRIIAGLCDALVVVEAAEKGGALITAEIANSYNKDVFAFPGNVGETHSEGCNALIKSNKAHLITSVKDIEYLMNWEVATLPPKKKEAFPLEGFEPEEQIILKLLLEKSPSTIDELSWKSSIAVSQLASLLLTLEFNGIIQSLPGKQYRLKS